MRKKLGFVLGLLVFALVCLSAGAYGATNLEAIKANLNKGIKFIVNGQEFIPKDQKGNRQYAITYNGTTYLPVRSLGGALNVEVGWDGTNNTVHLGEGAAAVEAGNQPATNIGLSRNNPAPIGKTIRYVVDDILDNYTADITLNKVIRGERAWDLIEAENQFNSPAPDGHEYLLANITFKVVTNSKPDSTVSIYDMLFTLVSDEGKDYKYASVVNPSPELDAKLYAGASSTGWAFFVVKATDKSPLLAFGRDWDGTKGAWFKP